LVDVSRPAATGSYAGPYGGDLNTSQAIPALPPTPTTTTHPTTAYAPTQTTYAHSTTY